MATRGKNNSATAQCRLRESLREAHPEGGMFKRLAWRRQTMARNRLSQRDRATVSPLHRPAQMNLNATAATPGRRP
jgi:hypothetical protein